MSGVPVGEASIMVSVKLREVDVEEEVGDSGISERSGLKDFKSNFMMLVALRFLRGFDGIGDVGKGVI